MVRRKVISLLIAMLFMLSLPVYAENDETTDFSFRNTLEYKQAEKSANERQSYYDLNKESLAKPVKQDKVNTRAFGNYPTRKGVMLISDTPSGSSGSFIGHAGIIRSSYLTEESFAEGWGPKDVDGGGVYYYDNDWDERYEGNKVYGITTYGTTVEEDAEVADWCVDQQGKPYNPIFVNTWTRNSFYCSQLLYAGYLDNTGINIWGFYDFILPMDLYYNVNTYAIYEN